MMDERRYCNSESSEAAVDESIIFEVYKKADLECKAEIHSQYVTATMLNCNRTLTTCLEQNYLSSPPPSSSSSSTKSLQAVMNENETADLYFEIAGNGLEVRRHLINNGPSVYTFFSFSPFPAFLSLSSFLPA